VADGSSLATIVAIARRDWLISRSYRAAIAVDVFSALVSIALYYFISRALEDGIRDLGAAPSYFAFALAGTVLALLIQSSALGLAARLREEQLTGTLEALVAQPLRDVELALGLAAYPLLFAAARTLVYLLAAGFILDAGLDNADWVGWGAVLAATTLFTLVGGLSIGGGVLLIKRAETLAGMATSLLALAGGAWFPVSALPDWLRWVADITPTRLAFDGGRAALYEGSGWASDALLLLGLSAVSIPLGIWLFSRAVARQRRKGALTEY